MVNINIVPPLIFIAFSAFPLLVNYFLKRKYKRLIEKLHETEDDYYHQFIFVSFINFDCRQHLIDKRECGEHCSYNYQQTLVRFMASAKSSICLCMYTFSMRDINVELIKAHKRGASVRIIADQIMLKTDVAKHNLTFLKNSGVPLKVQPNNQSMMHHKFCLIDKEDRDSAKMFFGSMNLTTQGLVSNFDNVVLTNNSTMIQRFSEEFEELWANF
ncbi:hypothetical protein NQ315_001220 [Exocentrus adspersus]|uniref:Mitochondrial cardiolipin hydrolase n=1 Tax=Exocentrus adspersus TaxID=1586481 RepID=A0AAV8WEU3_9CUCU|nr:hypothetical protein NQ315_001220 [Exocentrus adspersus]